VPTEVVPTNPPTPTPRPERITSTPVPQQGNVGDIITFGKYEWLVLETYNDGSMLIITKDIVEQRAYNGSWNDNLAINENIMKLNTTWENCDLRKYLNSSFYNFFSTSDRIFLSKPCFVVRIFL